MKIVSIHQPNFFPWLGYFNKILTSDIFIFLDDVQLPKKGGTWSNRVKIVTNNSEKWLTAELDRKYSGVRTIRESFFNNPSDWKLRCFDILNLNYKNHPFFSETIDFVEPLLVNDENNVAEYNIQNNLLILDYLNIKNTKMCTSSSLNHKDTSNELLCSLVAAVGGDAYQCGGGADGYQDEEIFHKNGIKLKYQDFIHPSYSQYLSSEFRPGLSVIDLLMNHGRSSSIEILQKSGL